MADVRRVLQQRFDNLRDVHDPDGIECLLLTIVASVLPAVLRGLQGHDHAIWAKECCAWLANVLDVLDEDARLTTARSGASSRA